MASNSESLWRNAWHFGRVLVGGFVMATLVFLLLPVLQAIGAPRAPDTLLRPVDTGRVKEPDPIEEPEKPEEKPPEDKPLDLQEAPEQVETLSFDFGGSEGPGSGSLGDLRKVLDSFAKDGGVGAMLDGSFDQKARATFQAAPVITAAARKRAPGEVSLLFRVDAQGRVVRPRVESSTDPVFDEPALAAIRKWRFQPARHKGKPVSSAVRQKIRFPRS
ncbi:MAG: energy transducer TonB [Planctomycetes bacterium]|nr:energy transducer TonB [Planctomycetota bacterium]MCB9868301.1 energy transducer TonB [Planctomycetota bacterium]